MLTTSYPRSADDVAGVFVADTVRHLRAAGVEVEVVSPADFRHFGIAFGGGIVQNLRAKPWLVAAVPLFLASYARTARRAARGVDVVHAHWIPSALAALATRKPFVLQVWGTDVELARRAPWLARPLVRRARVVIAASSFLAREAAALDAREVRVIPPWVDVPDEVGEPDEPPHVLFVGRLSTEKGILEFLEATEGLPRVIVGDGPLRDRVPEAVGFVPPAEVGAYYERAAVVCFPSRREGYGVAAHEAMAYGRPVVATRVGGLADAIEDGVNGVLVDSGDVGALHEAVAELLGDRAASRILGDCARATASARLGCAGAVEATLAAFERALAIG